VKSSYVANRLLQSLVQKTKFIIWRESSLPWVGREINPSAGEFKVNNLKFIVDFLPSSLCCYAVLREDYSASESHSSRNIQKSVRGSYFTV